MGKKTEDRRGAAAFDRHFSAVYGDRWPALRAALAEEGRPEAHLDGLVKPYFLDGASVRAARRLEVQPDDTVLDMCAAPGGKTLVLALALGGTGRLVSNDRSADRRGRLKRVIEEHLPAPMKAVVTVTGYDATKWGLHEQETYDRILLDVPVPANDTWSTARPIWPTGLPTGPRPWPNRPWPCFAPPWRP